MTGPEHYREAEQLLTDVMVAAGDNEGYYCPEELPNLLAANVHATLALAAATATNRSGVDYLEWAKVCSADPPPEPEPVDALTTLGLRNGGATSA